MENRNAKPAVKWAGGKGQLLNIIRQRIPNYTGKYIEPFVGGGAVFSDHAPKNAVISDANSELIHLHKLFYTLEPAEY